MESPLSFKIVELGQLQPFFIALFIGALVGVERTHHQLTQPASLVGLRTFILFAEFGAIAAWLSRSMNSSAVFVGGLGCVTAVVIAAFVLQQRGRDETLVELCKRCGYRYCNRMQIELFGLTRGT